MSKSNTHLVFTYTDCLSPMLTWYTPPDKCNIHLVHIFSDHWTHTPGMYSVATKSWWVLHSWLIEDPLWNDPRGLHNRISERSWIRLPDMNGHISNTTLYSNQSQLTTSSSCIDPHYWTPPLDFVQPPPPPPPPGQIKVYKSISYPCLPDMLIWLCALFIWGLCGESYIIYHPFCWTIDQIDWKTI